MGLPCDKHHHEVAAAQHELGLTYGKLVETADRMQVPGNQLEALKGDRKGQHSIQINDQWRICFVWTKAGPTNVEIVDYY